MIRRNIIFLTKTMTIVKEKNKYTFDEARHIHLLNGKPLYGVTSVLGVIAKPALIQWAASEAVAYIKNNAKKQEKGIFSVSEATLEEARTAHRRKKEEAGDIGTEVHKAVEEWIKEKKTPKLNDQGMKMFENFVNWAEKNKVKFLASEQPLWSEKMWLGGICDFVCEIDGKRYVGDIKTSKGIYGRDYFLQMAAYMLMLEEMGKKDFAGSVVVRLGKDGSFEEKFSYAMEDDKKGFLAALELFKVLESYKIKK